jgi:hypothetical protein
MQEEIACGRAGCERRELRARDKKPDKVLKHAKLYY